MNSTQAKTVSAEPRFKARFAYLRPYLVRQKGYILAGWIFVLVSTALDQVSPWMIKVILDGLEAGKDFPAVLGPLAAIVGSTLVSGVLLYFQRLWVIRGSRTIEYELRRDLFSGLMLQPKRFFDRHSIGDIMSRATNDLDRIRDIAGPVVLHLARMGCLLVYTTFCIWKLDPRLMLYGLLPSLMMPLLANYFLKRMYGLFGGIQKNLSSLNSFLQDTISGIQVVKSYGKQQEFSAKLTSTSRDLRDSSLKVAYSNSVIWPAIGALGAIGLVLVAWMGGKMVIRDEISLGTLSAAILYILRLQFPLVGLGWVASMIQRANVSIDRLSALRKSFVVEPDPYSQPWAGNSDALGSNLSVTLTESFRGIETKNLSFAYESASAAKIPGPPANGKRPTGNGQVPPGNGKTAAVEGEQSPTRPVLEGISLAIPAGTTLGIVGPTGSGKTTLMHILCGIYSPPPGTLFLNGEPRDSISDSEWIRYFTYAPQDGFLFSTSIRNNIEMGRGRESLHTMEEAAEWSALSRDLGQFPQGYDSMLGEKGINLSGGQRQRVGLARALLANSPVLGLDDTLSALDTETETLVLEQLRQRFAGRTVLIVSHRYSAVMGCDNIIFLADGKILEQGTHAELLRLGGAYASVWEKQRLSTALELD
ncbi:MAG: ABC transporter ATP-binding protein/permease [Fibrobacterota bacterium]|nr:ABC transporter ATP-binding protein/permease [Fibrobacterota bacterium]